MQGDEIKKKLETKFLAKKSLTSLMTRCKAMKFKKTRGQILIKRKTRIDQEIECKWTKIRDEKAHKARPPTHPKNHP